MATGSGKTTVMGMLAAWSILNKVNDRSDARFSDVVLIVCPNVTIRDRLRELDPESGEASLYRTRDLVPSHLMPLLTQGKVIVTNWHVFEPQAVHTGGINAKVNRAGVVQEAREWIVIGGKTTTARGSRYMTQTALDAAVASGEVVVLKEDRDGAGNPERWVAAVNADGTYGGWSYAVARKMTEVNGSVEAIWALEPSRED